MVHIHAEGPAFFCWIASICSSHNVTVDYAFQDINDIPGTLPEGRTKPWGTGQAVLAAKKVLDTPFIVINADDYYGKEGFKAVHEYLVNGGKSCMAGFVLKNTLSDNGGVTRGICSCIYKKVDEDDADGKEKAYKSFQILAKYLEGKGITGIIYPCTRTNRIKGKNVVLFDIHDAVPIIGSITQYHYNGAV